MITTNLSTLKIHKLSQEQYNRELAAGRLDENAIYLTPDSGSSDNPTPSIDTSTAVGVWVLNDTLNKINADLTQGSVEIDCVGYAPTTYSARPEQFSKIHFLGGEDQWTIELYLSEFDIYTEFYSSASGFVSEFEEKTLVFLEEIEDVAFMDWLRANATKMPSSIEPGLDTINKTIVEAINEVNSSIANVPSIDNIEYMDFTGEGTEIYVEDVGIMWDVGNADIGNVAAPPAYFRVPIAAGEGIEFVPGEEGPIVNIGLNEETREAIANMASTSDIPTKVSELTNDKGYLTSYTETDPTVPAWAKAATKPNYTAAEVGADPSGTASSAVSAHNTNTSAHADIREAISQLSSEKADKDELITINDVKETLADELSNNQSLIDNIAERVPYVKTAEQPTFVDSIEEMTDKNKMYVLTTDGMFYSYQEKTIIIPGGTRPNFENKVTTSTDINGSRYNGVGYANNTRLSSSGTVSGSSQTGSVTTGFIEWKNTDVVRMKGAKWDTSLSGHYYFIIYKDDKTSYDPGNNVGQGAVGPGDAAAYHLNVTYDPDTEVTTFTMDLSSTSGVFRANSTTAKYIRLNAYGNGEDLIVTINQEITYTTTEEHIEVIQEWRSTGISYNQPADYEGRVVLAENNIEILEDKTNELGSRVTKLEEGGTGESTVGGDKESYYNTQMNKLYADSLAKENLVLNSALETLCNRRYNNNSQSSQVIDLKSNKKQKLILHLHKRENDGYDAVNDVYLPMAQNDFSDVRITTDSGKTLKYQTVYCGNIDVISDSRLGNSDVSFLADGAGNIYKQTDGYIVKSTDAGRTWTKITSINNQLTSKVNQLTHVCEDGTLFFGINDFSLLCKSVPPYSSVKQVLDVSEGGTYTGNAVRPFQFVRLPTGEMLFGSYQSQFAPRIWKSTDSGDTWRQVYFGTDPKYQHVHRMNVDPYQNPVAVYAGLDRGWGYKTLNPDTGKYYVESGCVLRSTDGGETWVNLYEDQRDKPATVDHGVTYVDPKGYRLLGGETGICGGHSIIRTTDDINFIPVLDEGHAVYGPEKINGYIIAGGCGSNGGKNATLYMSDDEGLTWKQIYSEEPTISNEIASAGIKTFLKGTFAGTEQLIGHNMITEVARPSKRIISNDNSWYAEIIVDVPEGTNSLIVESGYMCPNLSVINSDTENVGEALFVMDFNENGNYIKEKVSGEIYKGEHVFRNGGRHLGYIYPDVKSAIDMNAIRLSSPMFDTGIQKRLNLKAQEGLTISFWLISTVNGTFEIVRSGSNYLKFDGVGIKYNGERNFGTMMSTEGGRFIKVDLVIDGVNKVIKTYTNGICVFDTTTESTQDKFNLATALLSGEKEYTLLKRLSDDDVLALQHFEIRKGAATDKEVYDSFFSGLTDNYSNETSSGTVTYTNLVPTSTDTDGSIYNGTGYKENVRLSSSGGVSGSAQNGSVTTGFIEYTYKAPFIIRIKGATWLGESSIDNSTHWYINFYDSSKNFLYGMSSSAVGATGDGHKTQVVVSYNAASGVTTFDFSNSDGYDAAIANAVKNGKYFRLNAKGKGADLIVTVNQEITE